MLTHTEGDVAESTMNLMLDRLRSVSKIVIDGERLLSASIGVAEARGDGEVDDTVVLADNALYQAKADGRDKVVYFERKTGAATP